MANKDYSEEFFYEYTPKHLQEELDPERDLSSYSKPQERPVRQAESPRPARTAAQKRPAKTNAKRNSRSASSTSKYIKSGGRFAKGVINKYGEICMLGLSTIIKVIAFVIAFGIIIASLVLGIMLFASRSGLSAMSLLVIIGGTLIAAIIFFPIYGIGHIISQNNEILKIFTSQDDE